MSARRCDKCRNWKTCPGLYIYFEPREIKWCWHQVIWLIRNKDCLDEYLYPPDPFAGEAAESGHSGVNVSKKTVENIKAELDLRLTATGRDGETLVHELTALGATWTNLSYAARTALIYSVGKRRRQKFGEWKSDREYYKTVKSR